MHAIPTGSTNNCSILVQFYDTFNFIYADNTVSELQCESAVQPLSLVTGTTTFYSSHGMELVEVPASELGRYPNVGNFVLLQPN